MGRFLKGQYFSFDAIVGGTIFILTAIALFSYWNGINSSFDQGHDMLSREAFRVSETLLTPVSPGLSMGWADAHINYSSIGAGHGCQWTRSPQEAFGSGYLLSIHFYEISEKGSISLICPWGEAEEDIISQNVYKMRRTVSYSKEDGSNSLGYFEVVVYEPQRTR